MSQTEAVQMVDRLRGQMLTRAMNMCKANGIEFDNAIFTTIFNNARNSAVASGSSDIYMLARTYSKLNPKQVVTTFTTEFKTNYTNWVEKQKADSANK